jgi:hypothetical protein
VNDGFILICQNLWSLIAKMRVSGALIWFTLIIMNTVILPLFTRREEFDYDIIIERMFNEVRPQDNGRLDRQMNDQQNVHDSVVTNYIVESTKRLGQLQRPFNEIRHEIQSYLLLSNDNKAPEAINAFEEICRINMYHMGTDKHETDILGLVWQRINHPVNHEHVNELKESLLQQLADCIEYDTVVCGVGRISRVLQTLECLDAEQIVNIRPMWAVGETIGDYCTKYSQKLLNRVPEKYREAINALDRTPEQQHLAEQFYQCVKDNLMKKFTHLYLDTHLLTKGQLDKLSKEYMDQLE